MATSKAPAAPSQAEVDAILGDGAGLLDVFLGRNPELRPEWKYYGPKHGWSLKVFQGKRNMCFVGHEPGAMAMAFILGERAYERLLEWDLRPELRKTAEAAKKYPEGRGVRLIIRCESDLEDAQVLLNAKRTK